MTSWPIGLSTGCFYHQSILDCLPLIRESGFSMIEVCSSPEHLDFHDMKAVERAAKRINELGMEAYSFHAPFAPRIDITSADEQRRAESVAEIIRAVQAAATLRVHYFVLHPGPEDPPVNGRSDQLPRMHNAIDSINQLARRCRELGIICVLENKLPHLLFGNTSDILWIVDGINTADIGVCLDTGHAFLAGDLHNLIHKLSGHLRMIHAHDNNGTGDTHLPPGEGKIDWPLLMQDLIIARFRGALMLEMAGNSDPAVTMANARRGRTYLRRLARDLALQVR